MKFLKLFFLILEVLITFFIFPFKRVNKPVDPFVDVVWWLRMHEVDNDRNYHNQKKHNLVQKGDDNPAINLNFIFAFPHGIAFYQAQKINQYWTVDECLHVCDSRSRRQLLSHNAKKLEVGHHDSCYGGDSISNIIFLEEDHQTYPSKDPKGHANRQQWNNGQPIERNFKMSIAERSHFFLFLIFVFL